MAVSSVGYGGFQKYAITFTAAEAAEAQSQRGDGPGKPSLFFSL